MTFRRDAGPVIATIVRTEHAIERACDEDFGIRGRHRKRANRLSLHSVQRLERLSTVVRAEQVPVLALDAPRRNIHFAGIAWIKNYVVEHIVRSSAQVCEAVPGQHHAG